MPVQDALTCFPSESLNAAFKRICSSVLYKAMFVFLTFEKGWSRAVSDYTRCH